MKQDNWLHATHLSSDWGKLTVMVEVRMVTRPLLGSMILAPVSWWWDEIIWTINQEYDWWGLWHETYSGKYSITNIQSEEAVLQTSWALQSVDLPGENPEKITAGIKTDVNTWQYIYLFIGWPSWNLVLLVFLKILETRHAAHQKHKISQVRFFQPRYIWRCNVFHF